MPSPGSASSGIGTGGRLLAAALAAIAVAYLIQLPTPLRLHNDTVVLVSMGESAARGGGFLYHGHASHYPPGYPAIVAVLLKLGAFHVWTAIALNFLFLALGLWAAARLVPHSRLVILLTLLSFVTIKHCTIPLTDLVFFGVAMACLVLFERGRLWEACVLVLAAIAIRRNGIALVPPLLWVLYRRRSILLAPALAAAAFTVRMTSTLQDFHDTVAGHTLVDSAIQILNFRCLEFGEIATNLPSTALPLLRQAILPWAGALALALIAAGLWIRRKSFGPTEIFFLGYAAILFVWPYYDPRFWLPVLPLVFGYAGLSLERLVRRGLPKQLLAAYLTVFAMMGALVLGVSIRITFSGSRFPDAYGNAQFRPTYCAYYGSCTADPKEIDADGLHLLRTYR
jgi:hypothetical protein